MQQNSYCIQYPQILYIIVFPSRLVLRLRRTKNINTFVSVQPSIHPFSFCLWSWWQQAKQASLSPANAFQLLLGDAEMVPGQMRYIVPPASSMSTPGAPLCWTWREKVSRETSKKHPDQIPKPLRLAPFNTKEQGLYSEPLNFSPYLLLSVNDQRS